MNEFLMGILVCLPATASDKPLELVGRDLNLAMKMCLEEEGQEHEVNG